MKILQPKKVKYKKIRKGSVKKFEHKSNDLKFGTVGLKAAKSGLISSKQIEAARQAISRRIKRKGKIWIRIYPHTPITKKPVEVRMGKGKGQVSHWVAKVAAGRVLFEVCGVSKDFAVEAFRTGSAKLCIKTRVFD